MEDKQLTTQESIDLISRMIENTRRNFNRKGGAMFLIWGYTTVFVTATILTLFLVTQNSDIMWLWWALPVIGGVLTWGHYRKYKKPVLTHLDKAVNYVWTVFAIASVVCAVFAFSASAITGKPLINNLFTIGLMAGMATAVTGLMIKFKPVTVGGFVGIAMSFIILFFDNIWQFPIFAAIFLVAQVVPGHMLNSACKKETKERG